MFTQTQIEELEAAIASGVMSVRHGDRQINYQSIAEMRTALDQMRSEVATQSNGTGRGLVAAFSRD